MAVKERTGQLKCRRGDKGGNGGNGKGNGVIMSRMLKGNGVIMR